MQIVFGDNLHEMSVPIFWKKIDGCIFYLHPNWHVIFILDMYCKTALTLLKIAC